MLFKADAHYAVSVGSTLVSFNQLGEYETEDEVIITALKDNVRVESEKVKTEKTK